jgi:hypothetical protein
MILPALRRERALFRDCEFLWRVSVVPRILFLLLILEQVDLPAWLGRCPADCYLVSFSWTKKRLFIGSENLSSGRGSISYCEPALKRTSSRVFPYNPQNLVLDSSQRPLFQFLGTAPQDKKLVVFEGGHGVFPRPEAVGDVLDWFDKYLGPVLK